MEILELIANLEKMAVNSKTIPMTDKTMVARRQLLELADQMRLALPRSVQDADEVLTKRERIINQTKVDARRIKTAADNESYARIEESELVTAAKRRYEEIIQEAEAQGRRLLERVHQEALKRKSGADEYARTVLLQLETNMATTLNEIRRGIEAMTPKEELNSIYSREMVGKS
jgi:hypothetical protein